MYRASADSVNRTKSPVSHFWKAFPVADIFIVATILHKRFKSDLGKRFMRFYDLFEVEPFVEKKMKRNKERVWKKVSNGTYHHEESEKDE